MGTPQIVLIGWLMLGGGVALAKSGEPRTGNHSFFVWLVAVSIEVAILYWGGFFG